jgi:hypothetical protein
MSFSDFKSVTVWPKENETRPLVFLIYAVIWFFVLLGFAWTLVGFNATSQLVENGTHVKILTCDTDQQNIPNGCSDDTTGNYIKSSVSFDAWCDGIIVGTITIFTYIGHVNNNRKKKEKNDD